jgi:TonB family protein
MRHDLLVSGLVHLAVVVALFLVRPVASVLLPGPEAVRVALVDASQLPSSEPRVAEAPAPAPEDEGVRIERPRESRRREEPRPEPPRPREVPRPSPPAAPSPTPTAPTATTLPWAPTGVPGLSGQVGTEGDFEFAYYLAQVRQAIAAQWTAPAGVRGGTRVVVRFRIARDGTVRDARISEGSGNDWYDQGALRAVVITRRRPPLPAGYAGSDLGVHFGFEYTGP